MGTLVTVTVWAEAASQADGALTDGFGTIERLSARLSHRAPHSDVSRVNAAAGHRPPVTVCPELCELLEAGRRFGALSDGAFDVTVGPLVALYARASRVGRFPADAELAHARSLVGWGGLKIESGANRVRLSRQDMALDLGGIAKGYIVDRAVEAMRRAGATAALVDAGGDIYGLGTPPRRDCWRIAVRDPAAPSGPTGAVLPDLVLSLIDRAVATSGDYERFVTLDGKRYSHIVDPRSGRPVAHMASVTVIAEQCTEADALATAVSVLGPDKGLALIESLPNVEALILHKAGGRLRRIRSSGFAQYERARA